MYPLRYSQLRRYPSEGNVEVDTHFRLIGKSGAVLNSSALTSPISGADSINSLAAPGPLPRGGHDLGRRSQPQQQTI
jgi:hypothetical protein